MLFNSTAFIIFFPVTLILFWIFPKKYRYICLFILSYIFYMFWNPKYIILIGFSTIITFLSGILIEKLKYKKIIVAISIILNLLILIFFKYFNFLLYNINIFLAKFNIEIIEKPFDIILPVGISFYTFQALSYTIDVYRGEIKAEKNIIKYALFVSFFPQLVAGPIERSKNLLSQLQHLPGIKRFDFNRIKDGLTIMLFGYFIKMVIADRLAIFVDNVFNNYNSYNSAALILGVIFFGIQIYCDFNGYSLIAIGSSKILGINLMENFNTPYLSLSIKEFWSRWHISLSTWFKDYLYIPLGGNRCSKIRKNINILIIFLVSGLWHGANFTFIMWGSLHGVYYIFEEMIKNLKDKLFKNHLKLKNIISLITTFILVKIAWIFFRANTIKDAFLYIKRIIVEFDFHNILYTSILNIGLNRIEMYVALLSILILVIFDIIKYKTKKNINEFLKNTPLILRWSILYLLIFSIIIFGKYGADFDPKQFIYFQF